MIYFDNNILKQFSSPSCCLLFMYLVSSADEDGMVDTSLRDLESKTKLPVNLIRQKLVELSYKNKIIANPSSKGTLITIRNFGNFRNDEEVRETNSNELINLFDVGCSFDDVWNMYAKKKGNIEVARKKWNKLSSNEKNKAIRFIPVYIALTETTYRKMFQTFLNQRTWEDEIIDTQGISVPVADFKAKLVEDQTLFPQFVERFNMMVAGTKIPQVDLRDGLTEKRRVLFNIAYCLHFHKMKQVMQNVINNPRLNGSTGFAADFDYIFKPDNFIRIYEGY